MADDAAFDPEQTRAELQSIRSRAEELGAPDARRTDEYSTWKEDVLDPLRRITSLSGPLVTAACDAGLLPENTGTSVMSVKRWRKQIETARNEDLCLFLLQLINERGVEFWARYHCYDDVDQFIEDVAAGEVGSGSEKNVVRTRRWLQKQDVPEEMPARQASLDGF